MKSIVAGPPVSGQGILAGHEILPTSKKRFKAIWILSNGEPGSAFRPKLSTAPRLGLWQINNPKNDVISAKSVWR
jgi:hypothetical protein